MREELISDLIESYNSLAKDYPTSKFIAGLSPEKISAMSFDELKSLHTRMDSVMRGVKDIYKLKSSLSQSESSRLAFENRNLKTDTISGLPGAYAFYNLTEEEIRSKSALLLLDLNCLKGVNDLSESHGLAGNFYIATMGEVIRDYTGGTKLLPLDHGTGYRQGGDEFAILFDNCSKEQARKIGERINLKLKELWQERHAKAENISEKYLGICYGAASIPDKITRENFFREVYAEAESEFKEMKLANANNICNELGLDPENISNRDVGMIGINREQAERKKSLLISQGTEASLSGIERRKTNRTQST